MPPVIIDNPILNSPYTEPARHFRFDASDQITNVIDSGRRGSSYFLPIAAPKKKGAPGLFDEVEEKKAESGHVNRIRQLVKQWRDAGWPDVTPVTRALLDHWHAEDRFRRLFFCQIEALETLIFITEVAKQTKYGQDWIEKSLNEKAAEAGTDLFRVSCKMATGSGKTVVMSMLIAWQVLNKRRYPHDNRFTDAFLVVAPGITIRDRLRVLLPSDPNNYYKELDIVPTEYRADLGTARVVVTNFHAFKLREKGDAGGLTKRVLTTNTPGAFTESSDEMVNRVCNDLGKHREIMVINDEAHHCYRGRPAEVKEKMTKEEASEAKARAEEARLWITGLEAVHKKVGVKAVFDLSATPFYLKGSGYPEGTLFPWVVSDFSLMDAIECGIVKIPRVPIADNAMTGDYPKYRNLWVDIREGLKDVRRGPEDMHKPPLLPGLLEGALKSLYGHYAQKFVVNRDRSLDPQLVWKGKDEQDAKPLQVPAVPIHVQEKVHPQAIIEAVKAWAKQGKPVSDLFADFNGLDDFSKKLEFYQHDQHWTNRLILGDSLLVMASLAEKERLRGRVQCVYFDPPYGIKFGSNWQVSTRKRDVKDAKAEDLTRQPEQIKAFRDTWELGIHSYLSYLRDRLAAARDLLTDSGSIFVQIGDENVHLVRSLMDEVFGSENHCGVIIFSKTTTTTGELLPATADFLLWYAKDREHVKYHPLYAEKVMGGAGVSGYSHVEEPDG